MLRMRRMRTAALACLVDLACSKQTTVAQMAASLLMQIVQPLQLLQVQLLQVQMSTVQISKVSMSNAHAQRTMSRTVPKIWSSCKTRFPLCQVEATRWTTLTTTRFSSTRTVGRPWRKAISSTTGILAANCCHSRSNINQCRCLVPRNELACCPCFPRVLARFPRVSARRLVRVFRRV
jgi:hypothetical protein